MLRLFEWARRGRMPILIGFDAGAWVLSFIGIAGFSQLVNDPNLPTLEWAFFDGLTCAIAFVLLGWSVKLHQGRSALGTFEDAVMVALVAGAVGVGNLVAVLAMGISGQGALVVSAPMMALLVMIIGRGAFRCVVERATGPSHEGRKALIIGAGSAGRQLIHEIMHHLDAPWQPVGLIDDDRSLRNRRIRGVPMLGTTEEVVEAAAATEATVAIIAIPSATPATLRRIMNRCREADLEVKVMPYVADMVGNAGIDINDVRDIEVTDVLGRRVIDTDVTAIGRSLRGKRVLVTGAGGSIGSELCRQLSRFHPGELMMLDRDESALHAVELSLTGRALLDDDRTVLGDIRDAAFLQQLFAERRPEVVFHAAALKHLPLLEKAPCEAIKTNVWGTLNVLEAAEKYGVERFINISTDKAANPCSVLGYSKRLAEGLTSAIAEQASGTYLSVRFGNVLGSRGSVLTSFAKQIAEGGPVTVTDPQVTRYFMTIPEAVQLVIQAAAIGRDGEALVLDMGEPVSIDCVARQLIELSGKPIQIVYTGLRPGEKMHEELFGAGEIDERAVHPLISHTRVPEYSARDARFLDVNREAAHVIRELSDACVVLHGRFVMSNL